MTTQDFPMTSQEYLDALALEDPEYWAWLQTKPGALDKVERMAEQAAAAGTAPERFMRDVQGLKSHETWAEETGTAPPPDEEEEDPDPDPDPTTEPIEPEIDEDVRAALLQFLIENELPTSLMDTFITPALEEGWGYNEILIKLRETPEYLAAYPENAMRAENGLSWWSESQIREYRDTANLLMKSYLGVFDPDAYQDEIANLIAEGTDLGEWERRLQTHQAFLQWGPAVTQALSLELGYEVPDAVTWAFMNPDIPTPELDLAYRRALMRGQPASLGFGIRPEEEADVLVSMGFSPEAAFSGYQGIAAELPKAERMRMIEGYINGQATKTPTNPLGEASYGLLFNTLMLQDPGSFQVLQQMFARETARFQAGGGPVSGGLLSPELR